MRDIEIIRERLNGNFGSILKQHIRELPKLGGSWRMSGKRWGENIIESLDEIGIPEDKRKDFIDGVLTHLDVFG